MTVVSFLLESFHANPEQASKQWNASEPGWCIDTVKSYYGKCELCSVV